VFRGSVACPVVIVKKTLYTLRFLFDAYHMQNRGIPMKRKILIPLFVLCIVTIVAGSVAFWVLYPQGLSTLTSPPGSYIYYTLKDSRGFILARSLKGSDGRPLGSPQPLIPLGNNFGLSASDNVISLQLSPDEKFLAIDGNQDHGERVWMYNVEQSSISFKPNAVMGNFLRWLPGGNGHTFLYRPMLPLGPDAPMDGNTWNPGLWSVDAESGIHQNINIGTSSADLIDAVPSPDGSRIVYSTTAGLGMGSDTYMMGADGNARSHLFRSTGLDSIAGLFTWSPDGSHIAYERLADSPAPFQTAGLWTMDSRGQQQQLIAQVDGGHGYMPVWSPDGTKIAFVTRTNTSDHLADTQTQALQAAIGVYDLQRHQSHLVASMAQTRQQLNINPIWSAQSDSLIFTALNPVNSVIGGTPRYWSATNIDRPDETQIKPITPTFSHVVAWE
jgi:Tol biopolymer transport system component